MATSYKLLGQSAPSATTDTNVYTVPSSTETVISSIAITNRDAAEATYRIALRPNGATIANEHYIAYGASIAGNDSVFLTVGITLDAADVVTVYASSANLSFNLFGAEIA